MIHIANHIQFGCDRDGKGRESSLPLYLPEIRKIGIEMEVEVFRIGQHDTQREISAEIERLERLAEEMFVVNTAPFPIERVVANVCTQAPILDDWHLAVRPVPCLVGNSYGHPILEGENRRVVTSQVFLFSEEFSCARTLSRWYRLGQPSDGGAKD